MKQNSTRYYVKKAVYKIVSTGRYSYGLREVSTGNVVKHGTKQECADYAKRMGLNIWEESQASTAMAHIKIAASFIREGCAYVL